MMFCPKCGSLLIPTKDKNTMIMTCKCGYTNKKAEVVNSLKETVKNDAKKIEIIGDEESKILPLCDAICPKCKHKKAFYWTIQTRASDEPETKFLKCEKCSHTWRDYA